MNNGKYSQRNKHRRLGRNRQLLLLVSVAILIFCTVGGTLAYLFMSTAPVENVFQPGKVAISVNEPNWSNGSSEKNNVTIRNDGNVPARVKAMIVVTWQDSQGNIYPGKPNAGADYSIVIPTNTGWTGPDNAGWYTYSSKVEPGDDTGVLIQSCRPIAANTPAGYYLVVDIIAEAIQADGVNPATIS